MQLVINLSTQMWFYISILALLGVTNIEAKDSRIIGGSDVTEGQYPWFAKLKSSRGGVCGGVLIAPDYVLTAAHCVRTDLNWKKSTGFEIGAFCKFSGNCGQKSEYHNVDDVIIHPKFNTNTFEYDFALIKLSGTSTIPYASIDTWKDKISKSYESLRTNKSDLWAIGFGLLEQGPPYSFPSHLQHVEVSYKSNKECATTFKDWDYNAKVMICAADEGKDACNGDSGGPFYDRENDTVVGLVSWGIGCAKPEFPGVYSRISSGYGWIRKIICTDTDAIKPSFCPCEQNEQALRFSARKNRRSEVNLKIQSSNTIVASEHMKYRNGMKYVCVPKGDCLNAFLNIVSGPVGSYQLVYQGKNVMYGSFLGRNSTAQIDIGC